MAIKIVRTDGFSLFDYPILQCWPDDGGRFITLPMVFSRNPDTGKRNCGMYRMQVFDERTAARLLGHYRQMLIAGVGEPQHGLQEIAAGRADHPGGESRRQCRNDVSSAIAPKDSQRAKQSMLPRML